MKAVICKNVYVNGWGKEKECHLYRVENEKMCRTCFKREINLNQTMPNSKRKRFYPNKLNKNVVLDLKL